MSNLLPSQTAEECSASVLSPVSLVEALPQRQVALGPLTVRRVLPVRGRRLVGPWCFFDRYGPLSFAGGKPMDVAQHPHIGLQTVSWLIDGEIVHQDSLGSECLVRPGQLSLMTAGSGIVHTEETPRDNSGQLNGVQLWVALPNTARAMAPIYQCTGTLDAREYNGCIATPFYGELDGVRSPGRTFSPVVGADLEVHKATRAEIPLEPAHEHGILLARGDAAIDGVELAQDTLYYLGAHRGELCIHSREGARLILIGGAPFGETILMWWNFVARTSDEIAEARKQWEAQELFPAVPRYNGPRIPAPPFTGRLRAPE